MTPESESSSLQNWGSGQSVPQSTNMGDYMPTPYSSTNPWSSMPSDQLINSGLPNFNPMGTSSKLWKSTADGPQVSLVKSRWMTLWV